MLGEDASLHLESWFLIGYRRGQKPKLGMLCSAEMDPTTGSLCAAFDLLTGHDYQSATTIFGLIIKAVRPQEIKEIYCSKVPIVEKIDGAPLLRWISRPTGAMFRCVRKRSFSQCRRRLRGRTRNKRRLSVH